MADRTPSAAEIATPRFQAVRKTLASFSIRARNSMVAKILDAVDEADITFTTSGNNILRNGVVLTAEEVIDIINRCKNG